MRRFLALLLFMALFFYLAMIYNSQSFLLLFFVGLVLIILLEIINFIACDSLEVECVIPKYMVRVGNDIAVEVHFRTDSIPSGRVMVYLSLCSVSGKLKRKARVYGHAVTDNDIVATYAFSDREVGIYQVQMTKVRVFDYLGILEIPKFCGREKYQVYVMPNVYTVPMEISEKYSELAAKMEPDVSFDTIPDEYEQIREYKAGDSLHDIHWKLTAKKDRIMVREHAAVGGTAIHLLLEGKKVQGAKNILAFIQVALSLSRGIAATGNVHYVAWFDCTQNEFVRMRIQEKSQTYEVLRQIMAYDEDAWSGEPATEIFEGEYKNKFGITQLPCLLKIDRRLSLQMNYDEIIRYKASNIKGQLCKNKLIF